MSRLKLTVLGFLGFIVMLSVFRVSVAQATDNDQFRWDIVHINFSAHVVTAGGLTSAMANDMSAITLTGSGTFRVNSGNSQDVTGGGTWSTSSGGSGNYEVTGFVSFVLSPAGTFPPSLHDDVCDDCIAANAHAGLVVLKVALTMEATGCSRSAVPCLERRPRCLRGLLCRKASWIIGTASPENQETGTLPCSMIFIRLAARGRYSARPPVGIVQWPKARRDGGLG
jgi:hypothetical protein